MSGGSSADDQRTIRRSVIDPPGAPPLDDGIVDRIMTFCPTLPRSNPLFSFQKPSTVFSNRTRSKSITRAVAYNVIGPLPQALRIVWYPYYDDDENRLGYRRPPVQAKDLDPTHVAAACPEEHSAIVITAEEKDKLQENSKSDTGNTLYIGYFYVPLANIWTARKVKPWKEDEPVTKYILDTIVGSQCATFGGPKLLTEASASPATLLFSSSHSSLKSELILRSDWHRLTAEPTKFLKGKLKYRLYRPMVTASFSAATSHLHKSDALWPWIAGIFDVKQTPGAWDGWGRDMTYCEPCLTKFLEDHVWLWYLNERVQKGWVPSGNCWYGYNCKTMVHKRSRVFAKNHLCVPTKEPNGICTVSDALHMNE
ncbi:hypothetical protein B0H13DRAFT_2350623 [Mycena leptocephala]|nr:hypothetical protein B0H13DRAFT_2350623 [Mycena leptocephala]